MPRQLPCPYCNGKVLTNKIGKTLSTINIFFARNLHIRIPTGLLQYLQSKMPVSKKSLLKGKCNACKGKGTIPDPSDDTEKWQQVKSIAQSKIARLTELENKFAPTCGNLHHLVQGHALWEVGLGMNDAPSYRVDKEKSVRNYGMADMSEIDVKKGGSILKGAPSNHVQGINSLASPGGHGMIKCANKFSVTTGAQGIDLTTGGPLNISAGIIKITGPELSIGTQTGRLVLEGETLNLNAKSTEITNSDGHLVNRGTFSNTGNILNAGHMHSESASVVHLAVPGKNETTKPASGNNKQTMQAFWGGANGESISPLLKDLSLHTLTNTMHPVLAPASTMRRFQNSLGDKMTNLIYAMKPYELKPTGYIIPGTTITLVGATCPCNYGEIAGPGTITGTTTGYIELHNFPHSHQMHDDNHLHDMRVPNIDISSDDAGAVRAFAGGASGPAPVHRTVGLKELLNQMKWLTWLGVAPTVGQQAKTDTKT